MLRRILVPVNFTMPSARAVAVVRDFCPPEATIRLLHVIDPGSLAEEEDNAVTNPMLAGDERTLAEKRAQERLDAWLRDGEESVVEIGNAADRIGEQADLWDADMIAMGTRGRSGIKQVLHGSATEWLVRHAKQPVLVVHDVELGEDQARHLPPMD
ncbi:universal stress protein [Methylonatrum kenyense]|uniref:universal stress protein n=1 Tax=Methylonatrum kenyense TaxID=455253 RepID=UPI0020C00262|nr:universal stress protein [Methylonatrum kenyense]MCK8515446.1 universal stress protein [Methylonatrum kenyense]